jgi:hypothetical protein
MGKSYHARGRSAVGAGTGITPAKAGRGKARVGGDAAHVEQHHRQLGHGEDAPGPARGQFRRLLGRQDVQVVAGGHPHHAVRGVDGHPVEPAPVVEDDGLAGGGGVGTHVVQEVVGGKDGDVLPLEEEELRLVVTGVAFTGEVVDQAHDLIQGDAVTDSAHGEEQDLQDGVQEMGQRRVH